MNEIRNEVLSLWFDKEDCTYIGDAYGTDVVKHNAKVGEFFSINPLHGAVDFGYKDKDNRAYFTPRRADINVTKFRSFLFEIDNMDLNDQSDLLINTNIPFTTVIYSGGKSLHAILSLEKPLSGEHTQSGIDEYKRVWKRLAAKINEKAGKDVVDSSCQNPSRLSRFPYYKANGRKLQNVLMMRSRINQKDFEQLLESCPQVKEATRVQRFVEAETAQEFLKSANEVLINQIKYPMWANDSAGLYPEAFKICLWAIDETGIPKEELTVLFEKYVFPQYDKIGYPKSKWMNAINHAYNKKGY